MKRCRAYGSSLKNMDTASEEASWRCRSPTHDRRSPGLKPEEMPARTAGVRYRSHTRCLRGGRKGVVIGQVVSLRVAQENTEGKVATNMCTSEYDSLFRWLLVRITDEVEVHPRGQFIPCAEGGEARTPRGRCLHTTPHRRLGWFIQIFFSYRDQLINSSKI